MHPVRCCENIYEITSACKNISKSVNYAAHSIVKFLLQRGMIYQRSHAIVCQNVQNNLKSMPYQNTSSLNIRKKYLPFFLYFRKVLWLYVWKWYIITCTFSYATTLLSPINSTVIAVIVALSRACSFFFYGFSSESVCTMSVAICNCDPLYRIGPLAIRSRLVRTPYIEDR